MAYRSDLEALAARQASLEQELTTKQRELSETSRLLSDARARARLPVLDNVHVASPCRAEWSGMTGDDRVRHCGDCKKNVYNLSALTREDAEQLIAQNNAGSLCVRYFQRVDGTIMLDDCSVGASRRFQRKAAIAGALAAGLVGATGIAVHLIKGKPEVGSYIAGGMEPAPPQITESSREQVLKVCEKFPDTEGTVVARVTLHADGHVERVTIHGPPSRLGECVTHELLQARFAPSPQGGTFVYPFSFGRLPDRIGRSKL